MFIPCIKQFFGQKRSELLQDAMTINAKIGTPGMRWPHHSQIFNGQQVFYLLLQYIFDVIHWNLYTFLVVNSHTNVLKADWCASCRSFALIKQFFALLVGAFQLSWWQFWISHAASLFCGYPGLIHFHFTLHWTSLSHLIFWVRTMDNSRIYVN